MNHQMQESVEDMIRDRVRKEVKAQLRRAAMARTREDFINRLVEVLSPALSHYYRSMLGTLNHHTDQVAKWTDHEEGFLDQFSARMFERTRAKGLDRKAAAEKAMEELMDHDNARRRAELSKFQTTYKLKKVVQLPKDAHKGFLQKVQAMVDEMFSTDE